jgi:hypothetical protein
MGKKGKGTGSFGKRKNKSHTLCRRYALDIVVIDRVLPRESLSERNPDDALFFLLLRLFFKASDGEMRGGLFVILSRAQDARAKVKEDKRVNICAME